MRFGVVVVGAGSAGARADARHRRCPEAIAFALGSAGVTAIPDDAELATAIQQSVRTYHHPAGTCRMGPDPDAGAVVDTRGRVHGVGLVVADASIMPRIPRANTNLPTMMAAERIAQDLTKQPEPVHAARSTA